MKDCPNWIIRWIERLKQNFPDCGVAYGYDIKYFSYTAEVGKHNHWWGIRLNPSPSPSVWQNRKSFRRHFDETVRRGIDRVDEKFK